MPRRPRSRLHPIRKRTRPFSAAVSPVDGNADVPVPDEAVPEPTTSDVPPNPAPYVRRRPPADAVARASAPASAATARPGRGLITDYGYVVAELKRIGLTFGGLIALIVILSRVLH